MNTGSTIFSQVMRFLPLPAFRKCVARYKGDHNTRTFTCLDHFLCMAFAQLTYRESLRDIEVCLRALQPKLYHMGIRGRVSRSTLADANENRDWRIYADFAQVLIATARDLYSNEPFGAEVESTVYALDATIITLCLSLFPWARHARSTGGIKLHTLLNLRGSIPEFIHISEGRFYETKVLDLMVPEPGAFYVMDRGYIDFIRLYALHQSAAFFVVRGRDNLQFRRRYSRPVDKTNGLRADQIIVLTGRFTPQSYPETLRRIRFLDLPTGKRFTFLTNNLTLPALTIAQLYKCRWQVELFFKWIKQHLRIKAFYGTSLNAVKCQIWIAVSVYVLIAIIRKRLGLQASLYTILQIFSVSLFEKNPILQAVADKADSFDNEEAEKQLWLL